MIQRIQICILLSVIFFLPSSLWAQKDKVQYLPRQNSGILDAVVKRTDSLQTIEDSITGSIREARQMRENERHKDPREIRFDFGKIDKPASPDAFKSQFYFPPRGQFRTGTCWCFSTISFIESEINRQTGQKIKLSEMYIVYDEYLEKVRNFVIQRGGTWNGEGSEQNAVILVMKKYGAMTEDAYSGWVDDQRFDHARLSEEIEGYLNYINKSNYWDEEAVVNAVKPILNKYMGEPPATFIYDGKTMTPREFLKDFVKINLDDYVSCMSTLSKPFHKKSEFEVWDNWRHDSTYYNLPLDEWYSVIKDAICNGYTVVIGGDVSEPGYNGMENAAVVPDFDIPSGYINQDSREFRFYNETTSDDHSIHLVGYTRVGDHDWYLMKDSSRRRHQGKFEGYMFYRDDYIRLKMLTFMVHRDALKGILPKD